MDYKAFCAWVEKSRVQWVGRRVLDHNYYADGLPCPCFAEIVGISENGWVHLVHEGADQFESSVGLNHLGGSLEMI